MEQIAAVASFVVILSTVIGILVMLSRLVWHAADDRRKVLNGQESIMKTLHDIQTEGEMRDKEIRQRLHKLENRASVLETLMLEKFDINFHKKTHINGINGINGEHS